MIKTIIYLTKLAIATAIALLVTSCNHSVNFGNGVRGNGNITTQTRTINEDFKKIHVGDGIEVVVTQSEEKFVSVEADDNLQQLISTRVENGTLIIEAQKGYSTDHTPKVIIKMPAISGLISDGGSNISTTNTLVTNDIAVSAESGSNMNIEVEADHITASSESGSEMTIRGKALKLETNAESGSSLNAGNLESNEVVATAESGSSMSVDAIVSLDSKAYSGASITYKRAPKKNLIKEENSGGSVSQQ